MARSEEDDMGQRQIQIDVIDELPKPFRENSIYLGIILASMKREHAAYAERDIELSDIIEELEEVIDLIEDWLSR